ncbi:MAG: phasin family protein [Alphaproteobacteria bacterium]|nr:MAG: phasin family protein [Alphaproteobacteria bacterium]
MASKTTKDTVEGLFETGKEQFESAVKAATQAGTRNLEQTVETARKQFDEAVKGYTELAELVRGNIDACIEASNAAVKGVEAVNAEIFDFSKKLFEANLAAYKSLVAVKSPKEFLEVQNDFVKSRYEESLAEVKKINDIVSTAANDALAPLNTQASQAAEKFSKVVG